MMRMPSVMGVSHVSLKLEFALASHTKNNIGDLVPRDQPKFLLSNCIENLEVLCVYNLSTNVQEHVQL